MDPKQKLPGLYDPRFEHDNCGIGAVANIKGIKTHKTVDQALHIVEHLEHRAGKDAEGKTGDGVGIMLQISHRFFKKAAAQAGITLGGEREYGVGMFFFPQDELARKQAMKMFEIIVKKEGLTFLGWRKVPTAPEVLGKKAVDVMPYIAQGFVAKPDNVKKGLDFDRKLYVVRRVFEQSNEDTYVVSLSSRTIVYKGMFLVGELRLFFADLQDKDYESAMVHCCSWVMDYFNFSFSAFRSSRLRPCSLAVLSTQRFKESMAKEISSNFLLIKAKSFISSSLILPSRAIWIRRPVRGLISFRPAMVSRMIFDKSVTSTSGTYRCPISHLCEQ